MEDSPLDSFTEQVDEIIESAERNGDTRRFKTHGVERDIRMGNHSDMLIAKEQIKVRAMEQVLSELRESFKGRDATKEEYNLEKEITKRVEAEHFYSSFLQSYAEAKDLNLELVVKDLENRNPWLKEEYDKESLYDD